MSTGRAITVLGLVVLNFIGVIFLETKLQEYFRLELVIIMVGMLLSLIALVGIAAEARWAWPFTTILFALSLANVVFLHVNIGAIGTFLLLLIVNVFGLLMAILSLQDTVESVEIPQMEPSLDTYDEPKEITYNTKPAKKKSRKKR